MTALFSKIFSFIMAVITFLAPWLMGGKNADDLTVKLDANATTGYAWNCTIEDDSIMTLTKSNYEEDESSDNVAGVGGTQYYYFDALTEGETDITFTYSPKWNSEAVEKTIVYVVTVDSNMNVDFKLK